MIVVCSTCQARFKVADEKIGPRGSKVRCSKCQTVFIVHKELGVMPVEPAAPAAPPPPPPAPGLAGGIDLDLEGTPGRGVRPNGMVANPFGASPDPFAAAAPPPPSVTMPPDPFGAGVDPFAAAAPAPPAPPPAPVADPFGNADPFAAAAQAAPSAFGQVDPFVAAVAPKPGGLPTSAVTDLSDLLGPTAKAAAAPPPLPAPPPPEPDPMPGPDPSGLLDAGYFDAGASSTATASPAEEHSSGLALTERTPPPAPVPAMPGMGDFAGADPFGEPPEETEPPGATAFDSATDDAFAEATAAPPIPPPQRAAPLAAPAPPPTPEAEPTLGPAAGEPTLKAPRPPSRVRAAIVNALSLAALLAVALGFFALSRGDRAGGVLHGGTGPADAAPFTATGVHTGLYERLDAAPLLFVSGTAVSNGPAAVAALRVRVEVLRGEAVVARGEARAGAVPTVEELSSARDAAALTAVSERSGAAAPAEVKPGASLPFLVAIADYPPDVAGARVRVSVEPFEPKPAAPPAPPPGEAGTAPEPPPAPEAPKAP
jgi:predicted Zn finger-like uncharacterized protein